MIPNILHHKSSARQNAFSSRLLCLLISCLCLGSISTSAAAQSPETVYSMAYATVGGNAYIQGGATDTNLTSVNQLFALDLTQIWNVSNPPWKSLNVGSGSQLAPFDVAHSMIVSRDQQSLAIFGTSTLNSSLNISTYNIASNSWSKPDSVLLPNVTQSLSGLAAVADPNTGLIYIPGGGNEGQNMMEYNPSTGSSQLLPMPTEYASKSVRYFTAVWSSQRNSILLYGGFYNASGTDVAFADLYEYLPSAASWNLIKTSGNAPEGSTSHCMVPAYNGTKMVIFGGILYSSYQGNLYILDVQSMKWSQGTNIDPSLARSRMACAVAGDSFVAWGGFGTSAELLGTPVVYDLKGNKWATQFTTVSTSLSSDSKRSSTAAIRGSFIMAIAAIIIGIFL
ncbi:hypothetical protein BGX26_006943 [Mortierella sp. AD094]|nr:hypothetical protein BGX26_006943 [Mortierella sp. AD094]